jgi:hypothetical protein
MNPSAWFHDPRRAREPDNEGTTSALVIAILFALFAVASFIVDKSISLPTQPINPPALHGLR